jgi:HK97 family phage major capsid protein
MPEKMKLGKQFRSFNLSKSPIDREKRTASFSFSSDVPYKRYWGTEILSHEKGAIVTDRLDAGAAPFLLDHEWDKQIGKVVSYDVDGKKASAVARISRNDLAEEALKDMEDEIKTEISVGYIIHEMKKIKNKAIVLEDEDEKDEEDEFLVTKWEPLEVSLVSVPADYTVGVGRSDKEEFEAVITNVETPSKKEEVIIDNDQKDQNISMVNTNPAVTETIRIEATPAPVVTPQVRMETTPSVEVKPNVDFEAELARVREIHAVGVKFGMTDKAAEYVRDGKSAGDFYKFVLDSKMSGSTGEISQIDSSLGLRPKERRQYNLCKAILETAYDRRLTGFEAECSQEMSRLTGRQPMGFFMPEFALVPEVRADLAAASNNLGGFTIQTTVEPSLIPYLRHKMVLGRAGATMMGGLVGNMALPRQITAATATWNTENQDPTRSNLTFDQVSLTPQRLSTVSAFSKQLLAQSSLDIQSIVRDDLLKVIAIAQDLAGLTGSGSSNQPTGIFATVADTVFPSAYSKTSPSVAFSSSGYPTWTNIVAFEGNVETNDVDLDDSSCSYIVHPQVKALWKTLAKFDPRATNQFYPEFLMEDVKVAGDASAGTINGYKAFATNQIPSTSTNAHSVIFGKFSDLIVGLWGGLDIITDPYTLASSFQVRIVVNLLTTIALRYGPSFCYSSNGGLVNGT